MATAIIALGSNLGDRAATIRAAFEKICNLPGVDDCVLSSLIENPAVGGPSDSPEFLNAAAKIETSLDPSVLMNHLLEIERSLGRQRIEKWGPRTIDLDLIFFGDQIIKSDRLTLPHPRMHERDFVLRPLVEIAPDFEHPVLHRTMRQLLGDLTGDHLAARERSK